MTAAIAILSGIFAGLFFYGGLWLTIRQAGALRPGLFFISFALRSGALLLLLYSSTNRNAWLMMAFLLAFMVTRFVWVNYLAARVAP